MKLLIEAKENMALAKLAGELDHHSAGDVRIKLENLILNKALKNLILDLSELSFMDSSGIGMIIGRYKTMIALGGKLKIVCNNKSIKRIIIMSGIKSIVEIYDEVDDALKSI